MQLVRSCEIYCDKWKWIGRTCFLVFFNFKLGGYLPILTDPSKILSDLLAFTRKLDKEAVAFQFLKINKTLPKHVIMLYISLQICNVLANSCKLHILKNRVFFIYHSKICSTHYFQGIKSI